MENTMIAVDQAYTQWRMYYRPLLTEASHFHETVGTAMPRQQLATSHHSHVLTLHYYQILEIAPSPGKS